MCILRTLKRVLFLGILFFTISLLAVDFDIDRRKSQYSNNSGYFLVPAPYSLPGIGEGFLLLGMATNIYGTQTDVIGDIITGDVSGYGIGVMDYYLIDKHLKFDIFREGFNKASFQSYSSRGMNSSKDDYINLELSDMEFTGLRATASFYDKMLEFYTMAYLSEFKYQNLRDSEGNVILDTSTSTLQKHNVYNLGFMLDYTDDRVDPRIGIRFDSGIDYTPNRDNTSVDYYVSNYNLTGYVPFGRFSTWAFNYFRSDAHVLNQGETDFNTISGNLGLDCSLLTNPTEQTQCINVVNNQIAQNMYGSATSLGGRLRLRSYPEGRFVGAHTQFYGTEFRWNITEESTPFDILFMKDIRSTIQTAFFYEKGSVSDQVSNLGKNEKESYGMGLRMITGSGLVFRMDLAGGNEDYEVTFIINYPWELF